MNSIYEQYGNMGQQNNIVKQFEQFKNTFRGDPQQQIQMLLNSGRITQAQYNNAVMMANQLKGMFKL